jgi:hypothetical protein
VARNGLESAGDGPISTAQADALAGALSALYEAQRECVRFGVASHREEDFLAGGLSIAFESAEVTFSGQPYRVASERMLRLYVLAGGGNPGRGDAGELLPALAEAVLQFQRPGGAGTAGPLPGDSASR